MKSNAPLFSLQAVVKRYHRGDETVSIFEGLDLDIEDGDFLAMMGPSGSGKSTLLNLLGGVDRPDSGRLLFRGQPLEALSEARLSDWRAKHAAFIFQQYNLLPMLSAARNVELPLMLTTLSGAQRRQRVAAALELVGLPDQAKRLPTQPVRRPAATRGDRAGDRRRHGADPVRRAHRQPRSAYLRRGIADLDAIEQGAGQDDRDGHPRPARRGGRRGAACTSTKAMSTPKTRSRWPELSSNVQARNAARAA